MSRKGLDETFLPFQDIALNETDFDERRNINKRKKLILQGRDPDAEDEMREKAKKQKIKKWKKEKKLREQRQTQTTAT